MSKKIKYRNLPNLLLKARETMLAQFRPIISHFGLTEQQWRILRVLNEAGELEQRELAETCLILGPSLTGILSRMEDVGLVARARMEGDQRRMIVRMTALGEKVVDAMSPLITQQYRHVEQAYGPEMMADLLALMDRFLAADHRAVQQVGLPPPEQIDPELARLLK
jgi:homoprotocatechuate degradation regulator HpaR